MAKRRKLGNVLPDFNDLPEFITSFKDIGVEPPGNNEEWAKQHLTMIRMAQVLLSRDKNTLTEQINNTQKNETPDLLNALIENLNYTRLVLFGYCYSVEWTLCRLSIVLGRNVLDDLPE